jgi:hypothetical protein
MVVMSAATSLKSATSRSFDVDASRIAVAGTYPHTGRLNPVFDIFAMSFYIAILLNYALMRRSADV